MQNCVHKVNMIHHLIYTRSAAVKFNLDIFNLSQIHFNCFLLQLKQWNNIFVVNTTLHRTLGEHVDIWDLLIQCIIFYSHSLIFPVILLLLIVVNIILYLMAMGFWWRVDINTDNCTFSWNLNYTSKFRTLYCELYL